MSNPSLDELKATCKSLCNQMLNILVLENPGASDERLVELANAEMADWTVPGRLEIVEGGMVLHIKEKDAR